MSGLATMNCQEGAPALSADEIRKHLTQVPNWKQQGSAIERTFSFRDYFFTMTFVNAVGWIAQRQNHHPDMTVGYNQCTVRYSTHSAGGLSKNDFICATRIDQLVAVIAPA